MCTHICIQGVRKNVLCIFFYFMVTTYDILMFITFTFSLKMVNQFHIKQHEHKDCISKTHILPRFFLCFILDSVIFHLPKKNCQYDIVL